MNRYMVSSLIGEGSFGRVYKAIRKEDAQVVAIKVISKRGRSKKELKNLRRECDIQATLKHRNIIEMLESFETKNDLVVVTEFALTDLHRYLAHNGALTEELAQRLICHLVSALYYLHSNRILHRDLKPQNVLLNETLHAKLCDFGLARNMTMGTHVLTSIKGTPLYMAPELLAERPYDHQADLWSLGCISYESMAGQPPFCTTSILHLVKLIKHEEVKWPSFLSSDCRSLLQGLLEKDPSLRISWVQILCHPFVEGKLFIAGVSAENSPFTNPTSKAKMETKHSTTSSALDKNFSALNLFQKALHTDGDAGIDNVNMMSSLDSINAIPPSDIENIETDIEDNMNRVMVPFAVADVPPQIECRDAKNLLGEASLINSQTYFVCENSNLILNHLNDNFPPPQPPIDTTNAAASVMPTSAPSSILTTSLVAAAATENSAAKLMRKTCNKDLEKRKLSQNLDNFSVRLGHNIDAELQRKTNESEILTQRKIVKKKDRDRDGGKEKDKEQSSPPGFKNSAQSSEEKQSTDNSPPCLLPGWDSCDESQSPPIENDEWLAFLHRSMQEVLDGELDSLKQQNLVSIIVAPLRNTKAIPKVVNSVAQLLSLPFVLGEPNCVIEAIKSVYVDVKLVPNLMYASKLLIYQKSVNDSSASLQQAQTNRAVRPLSELSAEEIRTASRLYELICHLVHLRQQFLFQFCDAVAILAADDLLINFLNHDFSNSNALRITNCVLALCLCVLRELPENAELVERVVFSAKVNLLNLLQHKDDLLRIRICMLFRLLARFSLRGLQSIWNTSFKQAIELLADDKNAEVREEAEGTLEELCQLSFYT